MTGIGESHGRSLDEVAAEVRTGGLRRRWRCKTGEVSKCVFCDLLGIGALVRRGDHFGAFFDSYPLSPGHLLIVPLRHLESFFDFNKAEAAELYSFVAGCKGVLDRQFEPSGYNLGVNDGRAAGQTVMHTHLHLIPRYPGDVHDHRGGVRAIFPDSARYWET